MQDTMEHHWPPGHGQKKAEQTYQHSSGSKVVDGSGCRRCCSCRTIASNSSNVDAAPEMWCISQVELPVYLGGLREG